PDGPGVGGAEPMPVQGPQATSSSRTPALISFFMSVLGSMRRSCGRDPRETAIEIPAATFLPSRAFATTLRSRNEEFTLLPTATCATSTPATSRTALTLSGLEGQAMSGSKDPRSMSTVSSYFASGSGARALKSFALSWPARNVFVRSSDGNTDAVAPSSVPMFAIVPRDGTVSSFSPGPVYSRTLFRAHFTSKRRSNYKITSFALTQGLNVHVRRPVMTDVLVIRYDLSDIAFSTVTTDWHCH